MSEWLPDTPLLARAHCPTCEPDADPALEILEIRWCTAHAPPEQGLDDAAVISPNAWISGSSEAGGEDNRRWCELFHRRKP